jgi:hypothetical protein
MDIFATHSDITQDYSDYIHSFIHIADENIRSTVNQELDSGKLWPAPLIQFNPAFRKEGTVDTIVDGMGLHSGLKHTFAGFQLFQHQVEAIKLGRDNRDFVVTSGTGSGKSLTYIASIFHHLLNNPKEDGIQAIIVYPMNALINSQREALEGFAASYEKHAGNPFPIRFAQYTGQEKQDKRDDVKVKPPHILLTNYMMLELILTRLGEQGIRQAVFDKLRFLVFDELHTYRGRQGADVALLIRRILSQCTHPVTCIGTSATMVSGSSLSEQKTRIAEVASRFFGKAIDSSQVITETLDRSISHDGIPDASTLQKAVLAPVPETSNPDDLARHPVLMWLESSVALEEAHGDLIRRPPLRLARNRHGLAESSGCTLEQCLTHLKELLHKLSMANAAATRSGRKAAVLLPFKLHQFFRRPARSGPHWIPEQRTAIAGPQRT